MLRSAVISDTDSVTGDAIVTTDRYGKISLNDLELKADRVEKKEDKEYYFFNTPIAVNNYINGEVKLDEVEYLYSHKVSKDIYEIELEDGKTIRVTEDHSIMVLDENGNPTIEKKPLELTEDDICMVI
jgi:intein/homing endonuclease